MQLRTKLFASFTLVVLLAGVIAYTGYTALNVMENYRLQGSSCNTAESNLWAGRVNGSNFLLYKKTELLVNLSKHFQKSVNLLKTVQGLAHSKQNKDACTLVIKDIQATERQYLELGKQYNEFFEYDKEFVKAGKAVVVSIEKLTKELQKTEYNGAVVAMLKEFYEIRILNYRFDINPSEEIQKEVLEKIKIFLANSKKQLSDFAGNYTLYKQLKETIAHMETYQKCIKHYSDSVLAFQADIPKAAKLVKKSGEEIDVLLKRILKNQNVKQERFKMILLLVTLVVLTLGFSISVFITRRVLAQLGRDPGVLVTATEKVMAGDFNINDKGKKIGVYGALVDMVKNLEDNIHKAEHQTEMAKEESEKARVAMKQAEEAQKAAERAKREGMLHAAEQLEGVVAVVSSASEQLSAQIEQSGRGAEQQSERVAETATAMEEMNSTVLEVARNSGQASELSEQAKEKAQAGARVVHEAGKNLTILQEEAKVLQVDMNEFDQHATAISEIMSVISDIADQTNLLALNAAIEAARAGEYGRGFAVVADEVRKLAEKTMASTVDVSNAITQIQESAAKNIRQVERTGTILEEVMEKSQAASASLNEIVTLVEESSDQIRAIATASEEQSATSEEINRSIAEVNTISGETSQAMQEASQAVMELSRQAQELSGLIQTMKNS